MSEFLGFYGSLYILFNVQITLDVTFILGMFCDLQTINSSSVHLKTNRKILLIKCFQNCYRLTYICKNSIFSITAVWSHENFHETYALIQFLQANKSIPHFCFCETVGVRSIKFT